MRTCALLTYCLEMASIARRSSLLRSRDSIVALLTGALGGAVPSWRTTPKPEGRARTSLTCVGCSNARAFRRAGGSDGSAGLTFVMRPPAAALVSTDCSSASEAKRTVRCSPAGAARAFVRNVDAATCVGSTAMRMRTRGPLRNASSRAIMSGVIVTCSRASSLSLALRARS